MDGAGGHDKKRNNKKRKSKKMKTENQPAVVIPNHVVILCLIVFEALTTYTTPAGVQRFGDYPDGLLSHGAEMLQHTRHTAFYLAYNGLLSAIRIRLYVPHAGPHAGPHVYPDFISDVQMHTTQAAIVHHMDNFTTIASQICEIAYAASTV